MRTPGPFPADRLRGLGVEVVTRPMRPREYIYQFPRPVMARLAPAQARRRLLVLLDSLRASPDVEYAQPNYRMYAVGRTGLAGPPVKQPSDPRFAEQWHYRNNGTGAGESPGGINLPKVWDTNTGSHDVVVGIIDTGILPGHPDITGSANLIAGYDMISDSAEAGDGDGRDADPTDPGDAAAAGECAPEIRPSRSPAAGTGRTSPGRWAWGPATTAWVWPASTGR